MLKNSTNLAFNLLLSSTALDEYIWKLNLDTRISLVIVETATSDSPVYIEKNKMLAITTKVIVQLSLLL